MKKNINLLFVVLIAVAFACKKEKIDPNAAIRAEVSVYVDSFFLDLNSRGIKTLWSKDLLEIDFFPDSKDGNGGVANGKFININKDLWVYMPHDRRKFLIYHELAHSVLSRPHTNTLLPNGEYKSLMRGGSQLLSKSEGIRFKGFRERYYIDELFDTTTVVPDWAKRKFSLTPIQDSISVKTFSNMTNINHKINTNNNFRIECRVFYDSLTKQRVGVVLNRKASNFDSYLISKGIPTIHTLDMLNHQYDDFGFTNQSLQSKYYMLTIDKKGNYAYYYLNGIFQFYKEFQKTDSDAIEFYTNGKANEFLKIIEY